MCGWWVYVSLCVFDIIIDVIINAVILHVVIVLLLLLYRCGFCSVTVAVIIIFN